MFYFFELYKETSAIYKIVNTRYAKKKKNTNCFFLTKMMIPIETRVSFGIETLVSFGIETRVSFGIETRVSFGIETGVLFGIHGIDFNLVFTSYKSSLFSGGLGVRTL